MERPPTNRTRVADVHPGFCLAYAERYSAAEEVGDCGDRVELGSLRDAGAVLAFLAQRRGEGPLVADTFGVQHPEADLLLDPLGECPQPARCGCVVVLCRHAGEAGEAVCLQPHVVLFWRECERLVVVALRGWQVPLVEVEVTETVEQGGDTAETVLAPALDGTLIQLGRSLELAGVSESLGEVEDRTGDPGYVVESLVDLQ